MLGFSWPLPSEPSLPADVNLYLFTAVNCNSVYRFSESCESLQQIMEHKADLQDPQHISLPYQMSPITEFRLMLEWQGVSVCIEYIVQI